MISREKAEELKSLGIFFETGRGDTYTPADYILRGWSKVDKCFLYVVHPSLSQLLHKIEDYGYQVALNSCTIGGQSYLCQAYTMEGACEYITGVSTESMEDAAADALVGVIKNGKG